MRVLTTIFLFISLHAGAQTTYRIAVGSSQSAFRNGSGQTILAAGDSLLFERGGTYALDGTTLGDWGLKATGTSSSHAYVGAYGTGALPVITTRKRLPGSNVSGNWTAVGGYSNVWQLDMLTLNPWPYVPYRIWIDGTEPDRAGALSELNSTRKYAYDPNQLGTYYLYVYSTTNPATAFSNIEYSGAEATTLTIYQSQYLDVENLDLRGSMNTTLFCIGSDGSATSDYVNIRNCKIGWDAAHGGVYFKAGWRNGTFSGNTVDAGDRKFGANGDTYLTQGSVSDGVTIDNGTFDLDIYGNTVRNWGHALFQLTNTTRPHTAGGWPAAYLRNGLLFENITIRDNYGDADSVDYCRSVAAEVYQTHTYHYAGGSGPSAIDTSWTEYGGADKQQNIKIIRNRFGKTKVQPQLAWRKIVFAYNIHDSIVNPTVTEGANRAVGLGLSAGNHTSGDSMTIVGNVWLYSGNAGLHIRATKPTDDFSYNTTTRAVTVTGKGCDSIQGNLIANNIFFNCGYQVSQSLESYIPQGIGVQIEWYHPSGGIGANKVQNNVFYTTVNSGNNLFYYGKDPAYQTGNITYLNGTATSLAGLTGWTISGNINADPLFVSTSGTPISKDLTLQSSSPAKNTGLNLSDYSLPNGLLTGSVWPTNVLNSANTATVWNMGAYVALADAGSGGSGGSGGGTDTQPRRVLKQGGKVLKQGGILVTN